VPHHHDREIDKKSHGHDDGEHKHDSRVTPLTLYRSMSSVSLNV
jgi:hypothetical protein